MPGVIVEQGGRLAPSNTSPGLAIFVLGAADWGPFEATKVRSIGDFSKKFGGALTAGWLYQAVEQLFNEKVKADIYVGRLTHYTDPAIVSTATAAKSTKTIPDKAAEPVNTLKIDALYTGEKGNKISVKIEAGSSANLFTMTVSMEGETTVEVYKDVSMLDTNARYVENVVNSTSIYIRVTDLDSATVAPADMPENATYTLEGGLNGTQGLADADWSGNSISKTGVYIFDSIKNKRFIMLTPGLTSRSAIIDIANYVDLRQVGFYPYEAPVGITDAAAVDFKAGTGSYSADGLGSIDYRCTQQYHPWGYGKNKSTGIVGPISIIGAIAARHANTDYKRGPYKPAAGIEDGYISRINVSGVASEVDSDYLNENGIVPIVVFESYGICIWGARTTSSEFDYNQVQINRTIQWFIQWCYDNFLKYTFEPIVQSTFDKIDMNGNDILAKKYALGWFDDGATGDPTEAYFFQCDAGNNTVETAAAKEIIVDFGIRPPSAAEIIRVRLNLYRGLLG